MNLKSRLLRWGRKRGGGREERRVEGRRGSLRSKGYTATVFTAANVKPFLHSLSLSILCFQHLVFTSCLWLFIYFFFFLSSFSLPPLDVSVFWFLFRGSKVGTSFWVTWKVKIFFPFFFFYLQVLQAKFSDLISSVTKRSKYNFRGNLLNIKMTYLFGNLSYPRLGGK